MNGPATKTVRIGIFERPGADFTLRRTLGLLGGSAAAADATAIFSRFVVVAPSLTAGEVRYFRCANLDEAWHVIGVARAALTKKGVRHIYVDSAVDAATQPLIDEGLARMEQSVRPAAANDPN